MAEPVNIPALSYVVKRGRRSESHADLWISQFKSVAADDAVKNTLEANLKVNRLLSRRKLDGVIAPKKIR